jgi:3-hydroxybutyryl-CoA dehydrogenase
MSSATLGIVGCGAMGTGIVEAAAVAGFSVVAVKATPGLLGEVATRIDKSMGRAVAGGKLTPAARDEAMARVAFTTDLGQLEACELVVESTIESLGEKQRILSEIEGVIGDRAILASNTSSLPLAKLVTALSRPKRFLGLHFFSPAPVMKLVEVAPLPTTDDSVVERACTIVESLGKVAIRTGGDAGYIVNRLLVPFLCQAIEMLEDGVAAPEDIDNAMKLGCRHPLGPLALSDLIGLDVVFAMAQSLHSELGDRRFRAPSLLRRLVLAGHLGKKTKLGLYDYSGPEPVENPMVRTGLRALSA